MKNFNENWDGIVRKNTQQNTQPINEDFGVPSYKSTDFSVMNKKTADVLVKELNRIGKYLDHYSRLEYASDALEDIKKLVKTLKTVK